MSFIGLSYGRYCSEERIVLVDYINLNRGRGMGIIQAVINGGKSRLRRHDYHYYHLGMTPLAISTSEGSEM